MTWKTVLQEQGGLQRRRHLRLRSAGVTLGGAGKSQSCAQLTGLVLATAIAAASAGAQAADQNFQLAVGQAATVELQENPSTGYRWSIDSKASSNLAILRIVDRGFSRDGGGKELLGAPGVHRWRIEAASPGRASITFIYRRSWEASAIRKHQVTVEAAASR